MADLRISELTELTTPLGTDVFPIVNDFTTKKIALSTIYSGGYQGTDLKDLSANWESTYLTVLNLSASWEESSDILPTVTDYLSTNNVLISSLTVLDSISIPGYNSSNWDSVYSTVSENSATNWNYQGTDLKDLSANWESTYLTVSSLSAQWEESSDILPTVTDYLSTNNVSISSLTISDTFEVNSTSTAPSDTSTPVAWTDIVVGGTVYKLPLYQ